MIGLSVINSSSTPSLYISSHARLLLNYSVQYRWKFLQLAVNGLYKQRSPQMGNASLASLPREYFLLNAKLSASLKKISNEINFFVSADNLFNTSYADRFGVPMPGRWWSGGVAVEFRGKEK